MRKNIPARPLQAKARRCSGESAEESSSRAAEPHKLYFLYKGLIPLFSLNTNQYFTIKNQNNKLAILSEINNQSEISSIKMKDYLLNLGSKFNELLNCCKIMFAKKI